MIARNEHPDSAQLFQRLRVGARLSRCMEAPSAVNAAEPAGMETEPGWRIRTILVPTDFSACSVEAVAQAAVLARHYDATMTILHVIDGNPPSARTHLGTAEDLMRQLWATGIAELRRLTEALAPQRSKTETRIIDGLPAEVIIENSASFDLLVISEPISKSAWHLFSRHTARRVIEGAVCPVLVVQQRMRRASPKLVPTSLSLGTLIAASARRSV